jgi:arylsulfatase A-like enzyme
VYDCRGLWTVTVTVTVVRVLGAGVAAGLLLSLSDLARVVARYGANLSLGADAVIVPVGVAAALTLVAALLALVAGGWVALANRLAGGLLRALPLAARMVGGVLGALPLAAAVALLNRNVLAKAPLAYAALVAVTLAGLAALLALRCPAAGAVPRWTRRAAPFAALSLAAAAAQADATLFVGLYPEQHRTLALVAALSAVWLCLELGASLRARRPASGRPLLALAGLSLGGLLWAALFALPAEAVTQNARFLTRQAAPLGGQALYLLGHLTDRDGDGVPALLGAGDCDNGDASVHPGAREVPDNGVDDDCLGGDLDEAARDLWRARMETPPPVPVTRPARHLVWISMDALRFDRFEGPAARRPDGSDLVPNLRRLAQRGVVFRRMYTPYPSTILSLYGVVASRWPSQVRTAPYYQFDVPAPDPAPTVAALLGPAGFRTGGFWFHHILAPEHGIGRGFEVGWVESATSGVVNTMVSGPETVDRALDWVRTQPPEARLFLWVHLYDPHEPYLPHPELPFGDSDEARYDAEVAAADAQLGRLVAGLEAGGVLADAAVWFFADHGEEFGDHGGRYHATSLYDELARVPALTLMPGLAPGVIDRPLSLLDVAPTSLVQVGAGDLTPATFQGASLLPLLRGAQTAPRPVFLECFRKDGAVLRGVVDGPWKLVHWRDDHFFELYHLERDPAERRNVFDLLPREAAALERLLGAWVALALWSGDAHQAE